MPAPAEYLMQRGGFGAIAVAAADSMDFNQIDSAGGKTATRQRLLHHLGHDAAGRCGAGRMIGVAEIRAASEIAAFVQC